MNTMNTNKAWKKAAAFVMALALMGGALVTVGNTDSRITASAASVETAEAQTFTVSVDSSISGGTVTVDKTSAAAGDAVTAIATPNEGYAFVKLTVNGEQVAVNDEGKHAFIMPAENAVISAEFAAESGNESYTVLTPANGMIAVAFTDDAKTTLKIDPVPAPGYELNKVLINGDQAAINDQGVYLAEYSKDMVISAEFIKSDKEAFTIAPCENGKITAEMSQGADFYALTVTPAADEGYVLDKLFCNGDQVAVNDEGKYVIAYTGETLNLSAEFVKADSAVHTITVQAPKNGTVTVDKQTAAADETVLITAVPAKGYKLDKVLVNGEQAAINDQGQYLIAMPDKDITVTAEFVADSAAPSKSGAKDDSSPKTGAAFGISAAAAIAAGALVLFRKKD